MFSLCSRSDMNRIIPCTIAETILRVPDRVRRGVASPVARVRYEAAEELARAIIDDIGEREIDRASPDQFALAL